MFNFQFGFNVASFGMPNYRHCYHHTMPGFGYSMTPSIFPTPMYSMSNFYMPTYPSYNMFATPRFTMPNFYQNLGLNLNFGTDKDNQFYSNFNASYSNGMNPFMPIFDFSKFMPRIEDFTIDFSTKKTTKKTETPTTTVKTSNKETTDKTTKTATETTAAPTSSLSSLSSTVSTTTTTIPITKTTKTTKTKNTPTTSKATTPTKTTRVKRQNINTKSNLPQLADVNYDAEKGRRLVQDALTHASPKPKGYCAKYVKNTIQRVGMGAYEQGHAYQCADILARNPNFEEVDVRGRDLKKLPAGCVIVYARGAANYSSEYGHLEFATGNDEGVSDFKSNSIRPSNNVRVFVPIKRVA